MILAGIQEELMKKVILLIGFMLVITTSFADINKVLNYQGYLTDVNNQPIADGQYIVQFKLYAQESGGAEVWSETQSLMVAEGYFNTTLGNDTALQTSMFDTSLWLGIAVGSDPEMVPRKKLGSAAYAMNIADDVVTSSKIKDGEIQTADIADNQITSQKIANRAVTNYWQHEYEPALTFSTSSSNWSTFTCMTITAKESGDLLVKLNISGYSDPNAGTAMVRVMITDASGIKHAPREKGVYCYYQGVHDQYSFDWILSNVEAGDNLVEVQWKHDSGDSIAMNSNDYLTLVIIELKK
jgi:hypothetical protein